MENMKHMIWFVNNVLNFFWCTRLYIMYINYINQFIFHSPKRLVHYNPA